MIHNSITEGTMKAMMTIAIMVLVMGCAGVSRIPLDEKYTGRQLVQTTISDPHAWAPTTQRSWLELCDVTVAPSKIGWWLELFEWEHKFANCVPQGEAQFSTATGYIAGAMQPLIYSGAMVGSAWLIGDGLSKSGPTVNQTGGGATQSQTQSLPKHGGK